MWCLDISQKNCKNQNIAYRQICQRNHHGRLLFAAAIAFIFLGSEFRPRLLTLVKYAGKIKGRLEGVCWSAVHVSVFRRNQLKMDWKVKDKHDQRRRRR